MNQTTPTTEPVTKPCGYCGGLRTVRRIFWQGNPRDRKCPVCKGSGKKAQPEERP